MTKSAVAAALASGLFSIIPAGAFAADSPQFPPEPTPPVLTPEEELKTFQLPEGYQLELVLSDPVIKEPVLCVFDGDGRMYVAEMRTYMQDIDGTGELTPGSLVSRHESTKRDGVFDKHTVFAGKLLLPRMVLPLDKDRVIIGETNTTDLNIFRDTKGNGVADSRTPFFKGESLSANMEHQPSGLIWSMDNWIYTSYNAYRLRWNPKGMALKEPTAPNGGQWGLAQDDNGKLWWSNAGAEKGLFHFQTHTLYAAVDVPEQFDAAFMEVWPAVGLSDFQGGPMRSRPDKTLNHFTGCAGQEVYRGDRLPADLRGDVLMNEPVGRLIRRAKVEVKDGITHLYNPYQSEKSEFIRSTDPYFRPVNITTGPDGCLYIVDMYRGIIQEGDWVKPGSYLRHVVQQYGVQDNVGHGRIWRLVHKDFQPGPQPRMLEETSQQLVTHLEHPNGWWRDTAQRLLVLRRDKSVLPDLAKMARASRNPIARMHALWTLEGLDALDARLVGETLKDPDPLLRAAGIRLSESLFKSGDASLKPDIEALAKDPDPSVVLQAIMTSRLLNFPEWKPAATLLILSSTSQGVREIGQQLLFAPRGFDRKQFDPVQLKLLRKGQTVYEQLCFACHNFDGTGMPMQGAQPDATLAPPLARAPAVIGPPDGVLSILLDGVSGPVDGKSYGAQMVSMAANNDEWIASVASYIRNSFGNRAPPVSVEDVARVRAATKSRKQPWTIQEIDEEVLPRPLTNKSQWKVIASNNPETAPLAIDGKRETRYTTGASQTPGQWFLVELPQAALISGVSLDAGSSRDDYPRGYKVELSLDGLHWSPPVAEGKGAEVITFIPFAPDKAKFVRITQTGSVNGLFWSIHELDILQPAKIFASAPRSPAILQTH